VGISTTAAVVVGAGEGEGTCDASFIIAEVTLLMIIDGSMEMDDGRSCAGDEGKNLSVITCTS
jgi:hypothetical protein